MLYDKNVFNTTAITGDFLNSDDSGLTTNVFLTDPFGSGATSNISLGVRFAQLSEEQSATIRARPDVHLVVEPVLKYQIPATFYHRYSASFERATNFRGVGPSLSWNASAPLSGTKQSGVLTLDWGVNAAALFGRQKTRSHHQSSGLYHYYMPQHTQPTIVQLPTAHGTGSRTRNAIVPNVGAFAGLSHSTIPMPR